MPCETHCWLSVCAFLIAFRTSKLARISRRNRAEPAGIIARRVLNRADFPLRPAVARFLTPSSTAYAFGLRQVSRTPLARKSADIAHNLASFRAVSHSSSSGRCCRFHARIGNHLLRDRRGKTYRSKSIGRSRELSPVAHGHHRENDSSLQE